jgi:hypothetical protein
MKMQQVKAKYTKLTPERNDYNLNKKFTYYQNVKKSGNNPRHSRIVYRFEMVYHNMTSDSFTGD